MTYCSECGAEMKEGAKFCPECGKPVRARGKGTAAPAKAQPARVRPSEVRPVASEEKPAKVPVRQEVPQRLERPEPATWQGAPAGKKRMRKSTKMALLLLIAAAIVGIVGLLYIGGVFSGQVYLQGGVPLYPGATEFKYQGQSIEDLLSSVEQNLPAGWSAKMYQTTDEAAMAMNWYRGNMSGWKIVMDNYINATSEMVLGYLCFTKGSDAAFTIPMDITLETVDNHYIIIMTGPAKDIQDIFAGNF